MLEKILSHVDDILREVTGRRVFYTLLLAFGLLMIYAMFENRQRIYEGVLREPIIGDYVLEEPGRQGKELLSRFVFANKNVAMVTIIDADPLNNRRIPIYRAFGDEQVRKFTDDAKVTGEGPLFNNDSTNNSQMLAIMNGEMICGDVKEGMFSKLFRGADQVINYTCRVPLPPAFRKTTGWISIHMYEKPTDVESFKFNALTLSLTYYNMEVASKEKDSNVTGR